MPQLITKQYEVFKFKELSGDVQEKVIEREREYRYNDSFYNEQLDEDFKETLKERGLPTETAWNISYSQGDGVSFYGDIDLVKFLKYKRSYKRFKKLLDDAYVSAIIKNENNHYTHSGTMDVYVEMESNLQEYDDELRQSMVKKIEEGLEKLRDELEEFLGEEVVETSNELEKSGNDYFGNIYSENTIHEDIEEREMQFLENGEVI